MVDVESLEPVGRVDLSFLHGALLVQVGIVRRYSTAGASLAWAIVQSSGRGRGPVRRRPDGREHISFKGAVRGAERMPNKRLRLTRVTVGSRAFARSQLALPRSRVARGYKAAATLSYPEELR